MREPYTQLYIHLVWATWDRLPLLTAELETPVYACIHAKCAEIRAEALAIGGTDNHVHLLARFPSTLCIADLAGQVKGASSHLVTHALAYPEAFRWQGGYGAFTLAKEDVPDLRHYVLMQGQHHAQATVRAHLETTGSGPAAPCPSGEGAERQC